MAADINTAADKLRALVQPHATPPVREQRVRKAPARTKALIAPTGSTPDPFAKVAKGGSLKAAAKAADPAHQFPPRTRPDRTVVRSVDVVAGVVQVTLASGTNARTTAGTLLADALKGGADGFPVAVMQHGNIIAKSSTSVPVPMPDPGKVDTVLAAPKG